MQSSDLDEIGHMDRLTQTQNSIDELVQIMYSTLSYLTRNASFKPVNPNLPVTQTIPNADSPEQFEENKRELVTDFLRKAKQLEYLISVLPTTNASPSASPSAENAAQDSQDTNDDQEFVELQREMMDVNRDYLEALGEAERLHAAISTSLKTALSARASLPPTGS